MAIIFYLCCVFRIDLHFGSNYIGGFKSIYQCSNQRRGQLRPKTQKGAFDCGLSALSVILTLSYKQKAKKADAKLVFQDIIKRHIG